MVEICWDLEDSGRVNRSVDDDLPYREGASCEWLGRGEWLISIVERGRRRVNGFVVAIGLRLPCI